MKTAKLFESSACDMDKLQLIEGKIKIKSREKC